jgi:hypothetical protein
MLLWSCDSSVRIFINVSHTSVQVSSKHPLLCVTWNPEKSHIMILHILQQVIQCHGSQGHTITCNIPAVFLAVSKKKLCTIPALFTKWSTAWENPTSVVQTIDHKMQIQILTHLVMITPQRLLAEFQPWCYQSSAVKVQWYDVNFR